MLLALVRPPPPATTAVLVAARDLPPGSVLTPEDVRGVDVPGDHESPGVVGALSDVGDVIGRRLSAGATAGELVTASRLVPRSAAEGLPEDTVAAHVLHADEGALDLIAAGQRVTIFADTGGEALARNILVLGVDTPENPAVTGSLPGTGSVPRGLLLALPATELGRVFAGQRPAGGPPRDLTVVTG